MGNEQSKMLGFRGLRIDVGHGLVLRAPITPRTQAFLDAEYPGVKQENGFITLPPAFTISREAILRFLHQKAVVQEEISPVVSPPKRPCSPRVGG